MVISLGLCIHVKIVLGASEETGGWTRIQFSISNISRLRKDIKSTDKMLYLLLQTTFSLKFCLLIHKLEIIPAKHTSQCYYVDEIEGVIGNFDLL